MTKEVEVHRLCCDYEEYINCLGSIDEGDPMYEVRKAYCEYVYCDLVCLEKAEKKDTVDRE